MTKIIGTNNDLLSMAPSLDPQERELVLAKNGARIRDIDPGKLRDDIIILIGKCYIESGQTPNEGALRLSLPALMEDMLKYFGTLTFGEIQMAWKLGLLKEFGEWFGLNNVTYLRWTKEYLGWAKRLEACKKQNAFDKEQNKPIEPTQAEKEAIIVNGLLSAFEYVKTTKKQFPDVGSVNYRYLDGLGLIPFSIERKKKMVGMAMDQLRADMVNEIDRNPSMRKEIQAQMANLSHTSDKVRAEAMRIALNVFFNELIEVGQEISDILKQ